ncbi:AraC family transcriptional regulator [Burkholderia gladioli]|uniref:AraC family transcriptional regulator n=1 Tax=Burkholderia gladioli TaxID=28095 RepID=UPI00163F3294|nr:AraC family transcriptional regulator [Burkholderia gladioli]
MDPLSQMLSLCDVRSAAMSSLTAGGKWALRFPSVTGIKFNAVLKGDCWIRFDGSEPHRLESGDTYLLTEAPSYVLACEPDLTAIDAVPLFARSPDHIVHYGGDDAVLIGGGFVMDNVLPMLVDALSPFVHIPAREPGAISLRKVLGDLDSELRDSRPGKSLMVKHLADMLFIHVLRAYAASANGKTTGWFRALGNPRIGKALRAMHADIARDWTVEALADIAGMSRANFAAHFKKLVGLPPRSYLTHWRMASARHALRETETSVARLAESLGYTSESAFAHAFRRTYGYSPGACRRRDAR